MKGSDQRLIKGILRGDNFWLREFQKRYRKRLFHFVLQKIDDPRDAEEIVQDTLMSVIYCLPSFQRKSSFWTWICSIAKHEIADFYRKRKIKTLLFSHFPFLEKIASRVLSPELALEEKELKEKIFWVLSRLTEGYREALRLKYVEGFSLRQMASQWQKSVKAVEMRLRRARFAFVASWNDEETNQKNFPPLGSGDISFFKEYLGLYCSSLPDSSGSEN